MEWKNGSVVRCSTTPRCNIVRVGGIDAPIQCARYIDRSLVERSIAACVTTSQHYDHSDINESMNIYKFVWVDTVPIYFKQFDSASCCRNHGEPLNPDV